MTGIPCLCAGWNGVNLSAAPCNVKKLELIETDRIVEVNAHRSTHGLTIAPDTAMQHRYHTDLKGLRMTPFWRDKSLDQLTSAQWEALCDGCGRCCLEKLKDAKTGKIQYTWVGCYLLDSETCRCTGYAMRHILVPNCVQLRPDNIIKLRWMPRTCAYRLVAENKDLPAWHPLVSGDPDSVHRAGISVRNKVISEQLVHPDDLQNYIMKERL